MKSNCISNTVLYKCYSIIDDCEDIKGLHMSWFREGREMPIGQYADLIGDYEMINPDYLHYAEEYVDEMFTKDELEMFRRWLSCHRGSELTVEKVICPVKANHVMPAGAIPVGGYDDFLCLSGSADYDLTFGVWGYYDIRDSATFKEQERQSEEEY